ncbi:hypothetical protein [Paucibacter sp. XJ19-41]|uniref:hypothetical protein n=1 Tax=Paucibacter sp. XJ19-41 TaxID=2927824 RepID=UPI00234B2E58|nr:hypothetical protein [Paucibacter sp. XJ19-41]MDC6167889.1 hypothetical protein [Paucibacter sp. XJ19-41]
MSQARALNNWPLRLQLLLGRLDRWTLGLTLLGLLVLLQWLLLLPLVERGLSQERQRLEEAAKAPLASAPPRTVSSAEQLAAFEASLASDEDLALLMRQLWSQGSIAGLQFNKVDYKHEIDLNGRFRRVAITLPMTGPYPAVRHFVFGLMADYPSLALLKLDMKREQGSSPLVETTAHLVLLQRLPATP